MVCSQKSVKNRNFFENAGHVSFSFCQTGQQRRTQNHAKPAHRVSRSSGQPFIVTTRSAGVGGVGLALAILVGLAKNSDIGWVGKKMVLRRIPIYFFLSTIFHDLKPKLASGTHQIRRRRQRAARSSTSQGRAEPLCARITGLNREVSEGKADV